MTLRLLRRTAILGGAISVAACSSTGSADLCDAVWSDAPVVVATIPDPADRPRVVLEEIWRAGGSNVGQELAFPASFAVSSSGRVAVVDHVLAEVVVIEHDGRWLGPWARRGRGPGELTMPVAANWNADTLVVFDVEQAKVSSYTNAAVAGPDVGITPEFISPVSASGQIDYVAVRSDRAVLLKYPLQSIGGSPDSAVQVVLAQRPGPYAPDTISTARVRTIAWGGRSMIPQPGSPEPRTAVGPDGWSATSAADGTYRILVVNPEGVPVHQICRDVDPVPLTAAELGRSAPTGFEEPVAAVESAAPPSRIGSVGRLLVGSTGELWVDRQRPAPFTTEGLFGVPGSTMDVYDATGTYIGEVQVPPGVSIQATAGSLAVGLMFSEVDEPWVIGYRVRLPGRFGGRNHPAHGHPPTPKFLRDLHCTTSIPYWYTVHVSEEETMAAGKSKRVREQVVVYLDARDRTLLDEMTEATGLPKTELFRRGLRRLAEDILSENEPGSSLRYLIATAAEDEFPADVAERADDYLYGGYAGRAGKKRARPR